MGKFVIKQGKNKEFYFNLKADNGQVILASEGYSIKTACENGIASVKKTQPMMQDMKEKNQQMENTFST